MCPLIKYEDKGLCVFVAFWQLNLASAVRILFLALVYRFSGHT